MITMKTSASLLAALVALALLVDSCKAVDLTRQRAIDCALRYVDVMPQDGFITPEEIEHAKETILTRLQRGASFVVTTGTIMNDCDKNHDGKISRADMEQSAGSCLNAPWKLTMFDKYVCKQAAAKENALHK